MRRIDVGLTPCSEGVSVGACGAFLVLLDRRHRLSARFQKSAPNGSAAPAASERIPSDVPSSRFEMLSIACRGGRPESYLRSVRRAARWPLQPRHYPMA